MTNMINVLRCMPRVAFARNIIPRHTPLKISQRFTSTKNVIHHAEEEEFDEPIKYSTSKASLHKPVDTFFRENTSPWYEPMVIASSLGVFLLYFCILREENNWDEDLKKSLNNRIPALDEQIKKAQASQGIHREVNDNNFKNASGLDKSSSK